MRARGAEAYVPSPAAATGVPCAAPQAAKCRRFAQTRDCNDYALRNAGPLLTVASGVGDGVAASPVPRECCRATHALGLAVASSDRALWFTASGSGRVASTRRLSNSLRADQTDVQPTNLQRVNRGRFYVLRPEQGPIAQK